MKLILTSLVILFGFFVSSQNLVPDPGFENWNGTAGFYMAPLFDWETAANTPDHHHMLNPNGSNLTSANPAIPLANSGNSGAGAVYAGGGCLGSYKANGNGNSEWASTQLISALEKDSCYKISFYIQNKKNQPAFPMSINNWGVYFNNSPTTVAPQNLPFVNQGAQWAAWPQVINDTTWHYVELYVTPDSNYTYLNIGHMDSWINSTFIQWSSSGSVGFYVWIDEVYVQKVTNCCPTAINSVTITNETCTLANGIIDVQSFGPGATYTVFDQFTGATVTTSATGNITGLSAGDYYVTVDDGTCSQVLGPYTLTDSGSLPSAGFNGVTSICANGTGMNLVSSLGGSPNSGGVWSPPLFSGGNTFNPGIDTAGTYTYIVTNSCGVDSSNSVVTITAVDDATIASGGPYCEGDPIVFLTAATPGGTWSGNGIIDPTTGAFDPSATFPGPHIITYTTSGVCGATDNEIFTIVPLDNASFSYVSSTYCNFGNTDVPVIPGTTGGTFSILPSGTINPTTGEVDIVATGIGAYSVVYTTNGLCPTADTVALIITDQLDVTLTPAGPFCITDSSYAIGANLPGGTWSGGNIDASGIFNPFQAGVGTWNIVYTIPGLCGDSDTIQVIVYDNPTINAGSNQTIPEETSTTISGSGGATYVWSPSTGLACPTCANTTATPPYSITYTLTGTDTNGCMNTDIMSISVEIFIDELFIPNMFSPNGDGNNDEVVVEGEELKDYEFRIFNRWGELVFETDDQTINWDGTQRGQELNSGVFAYVLIYTDINGDSQVVSGNITLVK